MSDGHGSTPETPRGWAAEQPPPYGAPPASPWTAPGQQQIPGQPQMPPPPPPQGYGQAPYAPYGPHHGPHPQAMRPGIIPLRPLRLGDLYDGTIKLVRSNPKAVLGLSAIGALLGTVPLAVGQALMFDSMGSFIGDPNWLTQPGNDLTGGFVAQYGGTIVSYLISFVVVTVLTGVLTRILGRAVFGGKMTASEAWQATKSRMPALFGVVGLMTLIMLAPLVLLGVLLWAVVAGGGVDSPEAAGGLIVVFLLLLLLYLGYVLFFRTRFAFAPAAVVLEGRGPVDAMRRSWNLVTGDFWRVFGILLLTTFVVGMVATVLNFPFTMAGTLLGMLGGGALWTIVVAAVLIAVGGTVGAMITYPFEAGVAGLLYADRRMRSEAFDLVLQTAAIEQQRQGWVHASADELWHPSHSARP